MRTYFVTWRSEGHRHCCRWQFAFPPTNRGGRWADQTVGRSAEDQEAAAPLTLRSAKAPRCSTIREMPSIAPEKPRAWAATLVQVFLLTLLLLGLMELPGTPVLHRVVERLAVFGGSRDLRPLAAQQPELALLAPARPPAPTPPSSCKLNVTQSAFAKTCKLLQDVCVDQVRWLPFPTCLPGMRACSRAGPASSSFCRRRLRRHCPWHPRDSRAGAHAGSLWLI